MAVLYRSFFAIRELSTEDGRPTNALFGFVRTLNQLRDHRKPTHWAVVFDGGLPAERMEALPDYKAHRPAMPDALREQLDTAVEYLDAARIPWVRLDGAEADDVMASLAERHRAHTAETLVMTSDKDLFQIVDGGIRVIPVAGKSVDMGAAEVEAKTGVPPALIPAWLALVGDSSDNIPGVPGIGRKTAAALLRQFGSLDAVWDGIESITSQRTRGLLLEHRELVERNLGVVTLRTDLDVGDGWEDLRVRPPDAGHLIDLFRRLEFHGMLKDLTEPDLFSG